MLSCYEIKISFTICWTVLWIGREVTSSAEERWSGKEKTILNEEVFEESIKITRNKWRKECELTSSDTHLKLKNNIHCYLYVNMSILLFHEKKKSFFLFIEIRYKIAL